MAVDLGSQAHSKKKEKGYASFIVKQYIVDYNVYVYNYRLYMQC